MIDDMTNPMDSSSILPDLPVVQDALRRGDRSRAHQICVSLTVENPENQQAWLGLAATAESLEEKITALNHLLELNPEHAAARQILYETMQELLYKDPFLAYQGETNIFYKIRTPAKFQFIYPKDRAAIEPFPPTVPPPTGEAFRWLRWSVIGLIPAGLGSLVCAPMAVIASVKLLRRDPNLIDHRRAWVVIWIATVLWLFGLMLILILSLHMV
jgi:hypothetical protein